MSLIVRLQGLPAVADSLDIRHFFSGLDIPTGGVYITGGKYGQAYIVFATCEEARSAMSLSGRLLKDSCIYLTYSNEEDMRRTMEVYQIALNPSVSALCYPGVPEKKKLVTFSYLYMRGLPFEASKRDIQEFFKELIVEDILYLKGITEYRVGKAIIKFGRKNDANEGLKLNMRPLCYSPVVLTLSDENEWNQFGGDDVAKMRRSPPCLPSRERQRSRSRSPINRRSRRGSPYVHENYVHLINLSYRAEKRDIKKFFFDRSMKDSQITFLVDKKGKRTREGFAMFTSSKDYRRALSLDRATFKGHTITILPISKNAMLELIDRMKVRICKDHSDRKVSPSQSSREQKYLYLRNFASDVTKADVQKFFTGQSVKEDDIFLLHDNKGTGLGEALVQFTDEEEASKAEKHNNETYLGIKILLSCITEEQMKALQEANQGDDPIVTEADDAPDSLLNMNTTVSAPQAQANGELSALDSSEVEMRSDSGSVPPANTGSEITSGSDLEEGTPLIQDSPTEECPDGANTCDADSTIKRL